MNYDLIPTEDLLRPLANRLTAERKPRELLIAAAVVATLTFGLKSNTGSMQAGLWCIRLVGAICAIEAVRRNPKIEVFDPTKELKLIHQIQIQNLLAKQEELIRQRIAEFKSEYDKLLAREKQSFVDNYTTIITRKEAEYGQIKQENARLVEEKQQIIDHYASQQSSWQHQWDQLEIQVAELEARKNQLAAEKEQLHAWVEQESARMYAECEELKQHYQQEREMLHAWADQQVQLQQQQDTENHRNLEDRRAQMEAALDQQRELLIQQLEHQAAELEEHANAKIAAYQQFIADQEATIESLRQTVYRLQQPELINGASTFELLGDRIIEFLYEHGVIVRDPRVVPSENKFELSFSILPIPPGKNEKSKFAESLFDAYQRIANKLSEGVPSVVPNCKTLPKVSLGKRRISMLIDVSGIDWVAINRVDPIVEADAEWLLDMVERGNHFRINGPTDSGKSALIDNIVGAMRQTWPELRLTVADPKYPFTEWTTFEPNYKGAEESFKGVASLEKLIDNRFVLARREKEAGRPLPEFDPELFVLDEAEILMDDARAQDEAAPPKRGQVSLQRHLTRMLRKGLKIGRGLTKQRGRGLKVAYVAQSPLCSRIGLNRDDLDQSVNIFLGENIPRALEEELKGKLSTSDRDYWLDQYQMRIKRGDVFFCLVKAPGKRPFMATLPAPGTYAVTGMQTVALSTPIEDVGEPLPIEEYEALAIVDELEHVFSLDVEPEDEVVQPDLTNLPDRGLELIAYVHERGSRYATDAGWIPVAKLRDNWGKDRGFTTKALKDLLTVLSDRQLGAFNEDRSKWRLTIDPRFFPR